MKKWWQDTETFPNSLFCFVHSSQKTENLHLKLMKLKLKTPKQDSNIYFYNHKQNLSLSVVS